MSDTAVKVSNISKTFRIHKHHYSGLREYFWNIFRKREKPDLFHALQDISFEVKRGEFYGIIGKNGSGKSTLLKIIANIYQPDEGEVYVEGKLIPFLELGVGFNPNLTARENVFLNGIILGLTKKEVVEKYDEIIQFAEVEEFQDMPLKTFSSGMQMRLAFSIAIQAKGDVYILDEVFAVGDKGFQLKSIKVIEDMIAEGKTILFVTHDTVALKTYATNIIYIKDHKVAGIGKEYIDKYLEDIQAPYEE